MYGGSLLGAMSVWVGQLQSGGEMRRSYLWFRCRAVRGRGLGSLARSASSRGTGTGRGRSQGCFPPGALGKATSSVRKERERSKWT